MPAAQTITFPVSTVLKKPQKTSPIRRPSLLALGGLLACLTSQMTACVADPLDPAKLGYDAGSANAATPDSGPIRVDDDSPTGAPTAIQTAVPVGRVRAGTALSITCQVLDERGEPLLFHPDTFEIHIAPADAFTRDERGRWVAQRAGAAAITCAAPALALIDSSPASVTVTAGPVHTLLTTLASHQVEAGQLLDAQCTALDAFGNRVTSVLPTLRANPQGEGVQLRGLEATIIRAGVYDISCHLDQAQQIQGERLEVVPGPAAGILVAAHPVQPTYNVGQVIQLDALARDAFDNPLPAADIAYTSAPVGESFGTGRFRFPREGEYTLTARVQGPTHQGREVAASVKVRVSGLGPGIDCLGPGDGEMIQAAEGSTVAFRARLADLDGLDSATINGLPVTPAADGTVLRNIPVRFGINAVDVTATDREGFANSRTCAFLASANYQPEGALFGDAVSLRLNQSAVDDRTSNSTINSLNDLLLRVLNSAGLRDALHRALLAANPLKPLSCDQTVAGVCVFRSQVDYVSSRIDGPHNTSLTLVTNGLRAVAVARNIALQVRVGGTLNNTGWVNVADITVDLTSNLALNAGRPRVSLRQVNRVEVGRIDLDFSGFTGLIIDVLEFLFQGQVRNLIRDQVRDYIQQSFNQTLNGILSSLDINALGTRFAVPKITGSGQIPINFATAFSSLGVSSTRALFGMGTRLSSTPAHALASRGIAYSPGTVRLDPSSTRAVAAAVHTGVINQALHALWRGGLLHAQMGAAVFGNVLPQGASAQLEARLPPVVRSRAGNKVDVMLGALRLELVYPGLFERPVVLLVGADVEASVRLSGNALSFYAISVKSLYFSPQDISLAPAARDILEGFLRNLLQSLATQFLNSALPAIPLPTFTIPNTLGSFGLPAGREMGLTSPVLESNATHVLLQGNFGLR